MIKFSIIFNIILIWFVNEWFRTTKPIAHFLFDESNIHGLIVLFYSTNSTNIDLIETPLKLKSIDHFWTEFWEIRIHREIFESTILFARRLYQIPNPRS